MATTTPATTIWRAAMASALLLAAGVGALAGCRGPVAPTGVSGGAADQVPVSVTVAVPQRARVPGLARGLLATNFTLPLSVRLASSGVGHNYPLGWKFETDQPLVEDPLDPGRVKALFTGITAQAGNNRIFRAQIFDNTLPHANNAWPARALDDVWGVSNVPSATGVVLTHETTPTAKVMRELLLTADGQRAEALNVADVQALVDRLRTYDETLAAPRPAPISGLHIMTEPIALAIANGAQNASGVYSPYVVPSPNATNKLTTLANFARSSSVRIQVLDALGKPATSSCVITLDDPLTEMAQTASGTQAVKTWTGVPVTINSKAFSYWTAKVIEPATGRSDTGKFTLSNGDNVTYTLGLPLKGLSERVAGGPGLADARWSSYPLQKQLKKPQFLTFHHDVLYWAEDGGAASDTFHALDMKQPNPRVEVLAKGNDITGITVDHIGNPLFAETQVVGSRIYSKIWRKKYFSGGTVATDPIVPADGSVELFLDCDTVSGWGTSRRSGPIAFDVPNKHLFIHGGGTLFRSEYTAANPATAISTWSLTLSTDMRVQGGHLYYGANYRKSVTDTNNYFFLRRRPLVWLWGEETLMGQQQLYSATNLSLGDLGFSRAATDVGIGLITGAPAFDSYGNIYVCVDGRILRYSSAYGNNWVTDTRHRGTTLTIDAGRNWLYAANSGSSVSPHEVRRVKVE